MAFKGLRFAAGEMRNASAGTIMKIVMIAISITPLLYGGLYLTAFLDPYENLDTVPVAVVNEDTGAEVGGEWHVAGNDVVEKLTDNHSGLGWQFVSADEAQRGLESGKYYMTCTIPSNFTETIASAESDTPEKAALIVTYNETQNMLASQIGGTVWKEVRTQVSNSIADEYWNTVFNRLNDGSDQIQTAADGAEDLSNGLTNARKGSSTITTNLDSLSVGTNSLIDGLQQLVSGTAKLHQGTKSASDGANALANGTNELATGASTLANGTNELAKGTTALKSGTSALPQGANELAKGTNELAKGAETLKSGTTTLADGANTLANGATQLQTEGTQALANGTSKLADETAKLPDTTTVKTAQEGAKAISNGFTNLKQGIATLKGDASHGTGLAYATAVQHQLALGLADTSKLDGGISELSDGISSIQAGLSGSEGIETYLSSEEGYLTNASSLLAAGITSGSLTPAQMQQLKQLVDGSLQTTQSVNNALTSKIDPALTKISAGLSTLKDTADTSLATASDTAGQIANGLDSALTAIGNPTDASLTTLNGGVNNLSTGYETMRAQLMPLVESAPTLKSAISQINIGAKTVNTQMANVASGASSVASGANSVENGTKSLTSGAKKVNTGANSLTEGANKLQDGVENLADGVTKVNSGTSSLADGLNKANTGAHDLAEGTTQLNNGVATLADGTIAAKDGSEKLANGAVQLHDGSQSLTEGLATAEDGTNKLADGLNQGAEKLQVDGASAKAEVMSAPVNLDEEYFTTVKNYGTGFAPYFISLGLWVGALMAGFVLKPLNRYLVLSGGNPIMVAFSSFIPLALMSIIQALLLLAVLQFGLNLQIDNIPGYYAFGILTALAFAAFMQFLMIAFGFPGKFIAIIFLMLQLTSAAGTFPIEQTPAFFQALNPFMPMTYVVAGMRQIMTGVNYDLVTLCVVVLTGLTLVSFALTALFARTKRLVRMEDLHPLLQLG